MPAIKLKDYDYCQKYGHKFDGVPDPVNNPKDRIPVISAETGEQLYWGCTSYCTRCNLDRGGWYMPKKYWDRLNKEEESPQKLEEE
jgi:hypothetical protein